MTLAEAADAAARWSSDQWRGFSRVQIERDFAIAMASQAQSRVRDVVAPVVLYFRGDKAAGKTSTANLLGNHGLPSYSTDLFVGSLRHPWHGDGDLRRLAEECFPYGVDVFIRTVQHDPQLAKSFVELFFDANHGFSETAPISIIEGYLHNPEEPDPVTRLDHEVLRGLIQRNYRVWVLNKYDDGTDPAN